MSAHNSMRPAGSDRRGTASCRTWIGIAALALGLVPSACSNTPPSTLAGPDPSDPRAAARPVTYRSTVTGYTSQRPAEPRSWGEQNQRMMPAPDR